MKFTVVSHACLYIEHKDIKLLIDPWIYGSCYWRSWWNYPAVPEELKQKIEPTHIYITHLHWDHFHGPSLRKFEENNPIILLPKHFNKRMKSDILSDFKFSRIFELEHGKKYNLETNLEITSYQFNPIIIDSCLVIKSGETTLLNANDSKTFGISLKQITNNHPQIDFVFRSHSSATPLPQCIKGINIEKTDRKPSDYVNDFIAFAKATNAKFAVPFASSHIYLHEMTRKFNQYYSDPSLVKKIFDSKVKTDQKCVLMPSNSSWSEENGFKLREHDFSKISDDVIDYLHLHQSKFSKQKKLENIQKLNIKAFNKYYLKFFKAIRFPINLMNFRFAFLINEKKNNLDYLCIVDGLTSSTKVLLVNSNNDIYNYNLKFVIRTPIYVFNDCNVKKMYNTYTPSKLLEITLLQKNAAKHVKKFLSIIDFYENDCLPIYRLFSFRNFIIILRRWREIIDTFIYIFEIKIRKKKIYQLYSEI